MIMTLLDILMGFTGPYTLLTFALHNVKLEKKVLTIEYSICRYRHIFFSIIPVAFVLTTSDVEYHKQM